MRYVPKEDQRYIHYYMKVARETRSRSSAARPLTSLASACLRLAVLRARVGCVCIEDAVCERCVLGFCVCRGRGKDPV